VIDNKETESGITIHLVDEEYDHGGHLRQARTEVSDNDTPETLAQKIHGLEYEHFPSAVEEYARRLIK
jgi:phosphoribosylglycinamide formyltransferase-1